MSITTPDTSIRTSTNNSTIQTKTNKKKKYDVTKDPLALGHSIYNKHQSLYNSIYNKNHYHK